MKHFMNVKTEVVASLDDDEAMRPASHLLNPEDWVPVHIHADGDVPPNMRYAGAGQWVPATPAVPKSIAFRIGGLVSKLTVLCFTVAILAFAAGLAVFAVKFMIGAAS